MSRRWRPIRLNVLLPLTSTSLSLPLPHSFSTSHPTPLSPRSGLTAETAARPANTLQLASCASVHPKPLADEVQSIGFNYNFLRNASNLSKSFNLWGGLFSYNLRQVVLESSRSEKCVQEVCVCIYSDSAPLFLSPTRYWWLPVQSMPERRNLHRRDQLLCVSLSSELRRSYLWKG